MIPPTFQELVGEAEIAFEGEVVETRSRASVEGGDEVIFTDVTFRVARALKGAPGAVVTLQFLGGVVGDRGMKVAGVPTFARGDRDVIFAITSQRLMSPLVRMMHGRVRIARDGQGPAAQDSVRQFDGSPLRDVAAFGAGSPQQAFSPVATQQAPKFSQASAMSLSAFESAVTAEVERQGAQKRPR